MRRFEPAGGVVVVRDLRAPLIRAFYEPAGEVVLQFHAPRIGVAVVGVLDAAEQNRRSES